MVIRHYGRGLGDEAQFALATAQPFLGGAPTGSFLAVGGILRIQGIGERGLLQHWRPLLKPPKNRTKAPPSIQHQLKFRTDGPQRRRTAIFCESDDSFKR
jgi:hypothetical protein